MRKYSRKIAVLAVLLGVVAVLASGCGRKGTETDYVEGLLDVAYGSDAINAKALDMNDKEISDARSDSLSAEAQFLIKYFHMDEVSKETEDIFKDISGKLSRAADYRVSGEGEEITVTIRPLQVYSEELQTFVDEFNVKKFVDADASCTEEAFAKGIADILEKAADAPAYGDEVTVKVNVTEKGGKYSVSDEDLAKIDSAMFIYE